MSNVVQFLEALACNPQPLSAEDYIAAVAGAGLDPLARQALLARDVPALNEALGTRGALLCFVVPAENDEPEQGDEQEGDEEAPGKEPASIAA